MIEEPLSSGLEPVVPVPRGHGTGPEGAVRNQTVPVWNQGSVRLRTDGSTLTD